MLQRLLLSDSFRHPRQLPPRTFDPALGLLPLRASHLRHRLAEPTVDAMQDGHRHVQIAGAIEIEKNNNQTQQAEQSQIANTLTNADIISLTEKKLPTNLIIQKIKTSTCNFNTSTDELIKLTSAGVGEDVISLMMEKK